MKTTALNLKIETDKIILKALEEDAYKNDITSRLLIPQNGMARARIIVKEDAVVCGMGIIKKIFKQLDPNVTFRAAVKDGQKVRRQTEIASFKGKTRALLTAERTALNFLGHLSGIATQTDQYVQAVKSHKTKILDTRKTTPGLRILEKYAVQCGRGGNHRLNLEEMILIKDNHRAFYHDTTLTLSEMIVRIKQRANVPIEVEVDNLVQFKSILKAQPDMILLDNMTAAQMKKAVGLTQTISPNKRPLLEASGGITLKNIRSIAKTGVDRISIGALTHTHKNIDFSMEVINA